MRKDGESGGTTHCKPTWVAHFDFFSKIYEYSNLEIVAGMIFDSNHLFQVVDWSLLTLPGLGTSYCNTSTSIDVRKIVCSHNRNSHVGIPSFSVRALSVTRSCSNI